MESSSILKKTMLAGIGVYSLTRDKAQDLMTDLVKRGELSKDDGSKFVKALMQKADEEVAFLRRMVDERVERAFSRFRPSYDDEFKKLNQKIDSLAKEVKRLSEKS